MAGVFDAFPDDDGVAGFEGELVHADNASTIPAAIAAAVSRITRAIVISLLAGQPVNYRLNSMVTLTRIYTRTGDAGQTRLANNDVASKTDPRLEAYGSAEEANCALGLALATSGVPDDIAEVLRAVQNDLFDVGADLATPMNPNPQNPELRVTPHAIDRLEDWCDRFNAALPALRSFVLPGGSVLAGYLNQARTIVRRAERAAWAAAAAHGLEDGTSSPAGGVNVVAIRYLNRLSDLLFILGRAANHAVGADEVLWVPGAGA